MLYQAQAEEITPLLLRAHRAWPHMQAPIERAEQLLLTGGITGFKDHFIVDSQSDATQVYHVCTDPERRSCTCPSYNSGGYVAGGRTFCKHLIAVSAYVELLHAHLTTRVLGSSDTRWVRQRLNAYPSTYLMRISNTQTITNISRQRLFFSVCWARERLTFASNQDAIRFAAWLHRAAPLPAESPARYDEALARQQAAAEWQVMLEPAKLQHWYKTGSVV